MCAAYTVTLIVWTALTEYIDLHREPAYSRTQAKDKMCAHVICVHVSVLNRSTNFFYLKGKPVSDHHKMLFGLCYSLKHFAVKLNPKE